MLSKYNMKQVLKGGIKDTNILSKLRCSRLIEVGKFLCKFQPKVITFSDETQLFEAVDIEWKLVKESPEENLHIKSFQCLHILSRKKCYVLFKS